MSLELGELAVPSEATIHFKALSTAGQVNQHFDLSIAPEFVASMAVSVTSIATTSVGTLPARTKLDTRTGATDGVT